MALFRKRKKFSPYKLLFTPPPEYREYQRQMRRVLGPSYWQQIKSTKFSFWKLLGF